MFFNSELYARHSLMADRHELQIKHQLILILFRAVELSTAVLKCLQGALYISKQVVL